MKITAQADDLQNILYQPFQENNTADADVESSSAAVSAIQINIGSDILSTNTIRFVLDTNVVDRIDGGDQKFMCGNGGTDVYSCPALTLGHPCESRS